MKKACAQDIQACFHHIPKVFGEMFSRSLNKAEQKWYDKATTYIADVINSKQDIPAAITEAGIEAIPGKPGRTLELLLEAEMELERLYVLSLYDPRIVVLKGIPAQCPVGQHMTSFATRGKFLSGLFTNARDPSWETMERVRLWVESLQFVNDTNLCLPLRLPTNSSATGLQVPRNLGVVCPGRVKATDNRQEDIRNWVLGGTWHKEDLDHEVEDFQQSGGNDTQTISNTRITAVNHPAPKPDIASLPNAEDPYAAHRQHIQRPTTANAQVPSGSDNIHHQASPSRKQGQPLGIAGNLNGSSSRRPDTTTTNSYSRGKPLSRALFNPYGPRAKKNAK